LKVAPPSITIKSHRPHHSTSSNRTIVSLRLTILGNARLLLKPRDPLCRDLRMNWREINRRYVEPAERAWRQGRLEAAEAFFKRGLIVTNNDGYVALRYAELLESGGLLESAREMFRIAERKLPLEEFKGRAKRGVERLSRLRTDRKQQLNYSRLAGYMIKEFERRRTAEYVDYFGRMGFSASTVLKPEVLFRFMSVISYDMRPLSYEQVWGPPNHQEFDGNSVRQALEELGLDLNRVRQLDENRLREMLRKKHLRVNDEVFSIHLHVWPEGGRVDHAKGLTQLGTNTETIAGLLRDIPVTGNIQQLYEAIRSPRVHGFGPALTSKTILFVVRCFGVGFNKVKPDDLRFVADGILGELVVQRRARRLQAEGIDVTRLVEELTRLGDPLSIELLYLLDNEKDFESFLGYAH